MDLSRFADSAVIVETLPPGCYYRGGDLISIDGETPTIGIERAIVPGDVYLENIRYENNTFNIRESARLASSNGDNTSDSNTSSNTTSMTNDTTVYNIANDPRYTRTSANLIRELAINVFVNKAIQVLRRTAEGLDEHDAEIVNNMVNSLSAMNSINTITERLATQEYMYTEQTTTNATNAINATNSSNANATNSSDANVTNSSDANVTNTSNVNATSINSESNSSNVASNTSPNRYRNTNTLAENQSIATNNAMRSVASMLNRIREQYMERQNARNEPVGNGQGGLTSEELDENTQTMDAGVLIDSFTEETPESQTMCAISQEQYEEGDTIRRLNGCVHMFKQEYIDRWLERHRICPMCRTPVVRSDRDAARNVANVSTSANAHPTDNNDLITRNTRTINIPGLGNVDAAMSAGTIIMGPNGEILSETIMDGIIDGNMNGTMDGSMDGDNSVDNSGNNSSNSNSNSNSNTTSTDSITSLVGNIGNIFRQFSQQMQSPYTNIEPSDSDEVDNTELPNSTSDDVD